MKVRFYVSAQGACPVRRYLDKLEVGEAGPVLAALKEIALYGLEGASVEVRHLKGKLYELKIARSRVFYVMITGPEMVLLHSYKKQSQKAPKREIETAERRMKEVLTGNG